MGVEDEFDEMRRIINRMLNDAVQGRPEEPEEEAAAPRRRPAGKPPLRRYILRVPPMPSLPDPEVALNGSSASVTWDLSPASPTDLAARVSGRILLLEVEGPQPLKRVIELPFELAPDVRWTLRNGVADLIVCRKDGPR